MNQKMGFIADSSPSSLVKARCQQSQKGRDWGEVPPKPTSRNASRNDRETLTLYK